MATIDASIAMSGRLPKIDSPLEAQAKVMQFREMQQRNRLAEMMFADKERESGERNALSGIMSDQSNYDAAGNLRRQALPKIGATAPGQYGAFQKQIGEQEKAQREVEKEKIARAKSEMELVGQVAGAAVDQASYTRGLQLLQQAGIDVSQIPPQFDPAYVQQAQAQAMSATQQLEQMRKNLELRSAKPEKIDSGQQISYRDMNPNSPTYGQATGGDAVQKVQSPDSVASTAARMANADATRDVAAATRDAAGMQRDRDTEMKIADDYRAQSKPFKEVGDAYRLINATLDKAAQSPAATLAAATKFMKLLDPGSVVRESELGMALAASGVIDRAFNYYNVLQRGKVLTPSQVKDFKNITEQIYAAAQEGQKSIDASYKQQAATYGLRPEMIVQDLGQNAPKKSSAKPAGPSIDDLLKKYGD